ncbi:MAG TPA: pre-peptidase C-terminal domain-containing protein [Candidatus Eisenbacteria bacterium]|nr:pre-peptidase C-terminal domain-containing protein [Candidatus Eisenbacteria bacterium]
MEVQAARSAPSWRTLQAGLPALASQVPLTVTDGGSNPANATLIQAPIFRDTGTTVGKGNDIVLPPCTSGGADTSPDTFYKLTLPQGGVINAWTTCASAGIQTYDTRLAIFTEGFTILACNDDDPGCGYQSRISDFSVSAGTYYIVVDGYNGEAGPYELNVRWQGPGPACSGSDAGTATMISSLPYSDTRDLSNDCDDYLVTCELGGNQGGPDHWYQITVDAPVLMDVTLGCDSSHIDTRIAILNQDQAQVACNDNAPSCPSGQSSIVDALLSEGTYYVVIDNANLTGGAYSVLVDTTHAPPSAITQVRPDIFTRTNELYDHEIVTNIVPGRTHLRFSNATANVGQGRLYLYGVLPDNGDGTQDVRQRVWRSDSTYFDREAGAFEYHQGHSHIHLQDWATYRLRAVTGGGGVGAVLVQGDKTSFCILDLIVHDSSLPGAPPSGVFTSCSSTIQGLSVGWADIYDKSLSGQNLDITGLPAGQYWLESEVDPNDHILEMDESNNIARILVTIGNAGPINPDPYEPNNQLSDLDPRPIGGPNSPVLGPCNPIRTIPNLTIQTAGNDDYYRFYMPATGSNADEVRIDFPNSQGNLDLALLNAAGTVLATAATSSNTEKISLNNRPPGWYNVRVYGAASPGYALTINPSQNGAPAVTVTNPPAGNWGVSETGTYTTTWTASDPEGNPTWVDVFLNTSPALDGNEIFLATSQATPGAQGFYVINPASLPQAKYYVYVRITDGGTTTGDWSTGTITILDVTGVENSPVAAAWRLLPSAPNPFNPEVALRLEVKQQSRVSWRIHDARGALVRTLEKGPLPVGLHERRWDGRDDRGRSVASGVYYMIVEAEGFTGRRKLTLLR